MAPFPLTSSLLESEAKCKSREKIWLWRLSKSLINMAKVSSTLMTWETISTLLSIPLSFPNRRPRRKSSPSSCSLLKHIIEIAIGLVKERILCMSNSSKNLWFRRRNTTISAIVLTQLRKKWSHLERLPLRWQKRSSSTITKTSPPPSTMTLSSPIWSTDPGASTKRSMFPKASAESHSTGRQKTTTKMIQGLRKSTRSSASPNTRRKILPRSSKSMKTNRLNK